MAREKPFLSLCMIAKNEEKFLRSNVPLAAPHCDEIIVVDTGSSDRTRAIAFENGATLFDFPWIDDFSAARNYSIEQAGGEWILVIDADEQIEAEGWKTLLQSLRSAKEDYFNLRVLHYSLHNYVAGLKPNTFAFGEYGGYPGYQEAWLARAFKNKPEFRFSGFIHEQLTRNGQPLPRNPLDVRVHNHANALSKEKMAAKRDLYFRLGIKKFNANPNDFQSALEAGIACLEVGQFQWAERALSRAFKLNRTHIRTIMALGAAMQGLAKYDEAEKYFLIALSLNPETPSVHNALGLVYCHVGRWDLAIAELNKELEKNPSSAQAQFWLKKALNEKARQTTNG